MIQCIACSKRQLEDLDEADVTRGISTDKDTAKSLTSQIKDMVMKFSAVYRQCKPGGGSSSSGSYRKSQNHRPYYSYDDMGRGIGGGFHHNYDPFHASRGGSSSSTPAWDFTHIGGTHAESWMGGAGFTGVDTFEGGPVVAVGDEEEAKEWVAQVEPGVHITFIALPRGGNDLKRIRFSREMFNKWQAQRWWGENYDRIMELYNVQRFNRQALTTPPRSEDERESSYSRVGSTRESPVTRSFGMEKSPCNNSSFSSSSSRAPTATSNNGAAERNVMFPTTAPAPDPTEHLLQQQQYRDNYQPSAAGGGFGKCEASSFDASRTTTSSRGEAASVSLSDAEMTEWVAQDEPGVYITIRQLLDGSRELRRVRFSRERFGEVHAKLWWEENRERIHAQYL